jgi:hypothetical protein
MNRLSLVAFAVFMVVLFAVSCGQAFDLYVYNSTYELLHKQKVKIPGVPDVSQASIDKAMVLYSIKSKPWCKYPVLVEDIEDIMGYIGGYPFSSTRIIGITGRAFTSWGMLGSVLAHEIEVHCNQSFIKANILDAIDVLLGDLIRSQEPPKSAMLVRVAPVYYGTWLTEREAYSYQIESAERFGLTKQEVESIRFTRDFLYPPR